MFLPFIESGRVHVEGMYCRCGLLIPGYVLRVADFFKASEAAGRQATNHGKLVKLVILVALVLHNFTWSTVGIELTNRTYSTNSTNKTD